MYMAGIPHTTFLHLTPSFWFQGFSADGQDLNLLEVPARLLIMMLHVGQRLQEGYSGV